MRPFLLLLALLLVPAVTQAQHIRFLQVEIAGDSVTLLSSTVREGRLKPTPSGPGRLHADVIGATGEVLWQGSIPYEIREYPADDGTIRPLREPVLPRHVLIRIPDDARAKSVELYRVVPSGVAGKTNRNVIGVINL